jgi:hypothetical protein
MLGTATVGDTKPLGAVTATLKAAHAHRHSNVLHRHCPDHRRPSLRGAGRHPPYGYIWKLLAPSECGVMLVTCITMSPLPKVPLLLASTYTVALPAA